MEYLIFLIVVFVALTIYHLLQYRKSNYNKLDYYLHDKTNGLIAFVVSLTLFLGSISFFIAFIWGGGLLFRWIFNWLFYGI